MVNFYFSIRTSGRSTHVTVGGGFPLKEHDNFSSASGTAYKVFDDVRRGASEKKNKQIKQREKILTGDINFYSGGFLGFKYGAFVAAISIATKGTIVFRFHFS